MQNIVAIRHLDPSFGVYGLLPRGAWENPGMFGKDSGIQTGIHIRQGVEDERVDQNLGRTTGLC
jgi:hypothetical protein